MALEVRPDGTCCIWGAWIASDAGHVVEAHTTQELSPAAAGITDLEDRLRTDIDATAATVGARDSLAGVVDTVELSVEVDFIAHRNHIASGAPILVNAIWCSPVSVRRRVRLM
jgi:hypothetical protein